ncbi:MAG: HlyD family secretion protein [Halieaceae bacterium]|nr:HlyD family secretion protein [Halieaceae bacterium]
MAMNKHLATLSVVLLGVLLAAWKYWDYINNPWTRDGVVRAYVIQVTPRVSGPVVELPIVDDQAVKAGDLLFRIDPRTYKANLDKAEAEAVRTAGDYERAQELVRRGDISQRDFDKAEAAYNVAIANREQAQLDLEFTEVVAPVDGYITNLDLREGSQAVANNPEMALVDTNSFWINGYFRETMIQDIDTGDRAIVTLMTYPDTPITGTVESIGWGIARQDGSTSYELLPAISPTFSWIRLAQRVPVRIKLDPLPAGIQLRVGTTASVLVKAGS